MSIFKSYLYRLTGKRDLHFGCSNLHGQDAKILDTQWLISIYQIWRKLIQNFAVIVNCCGMYDYSVGQVTRRSSRTTGMINVYKFTVTTRKTTNSKRKSPSGKVSNSLSSDCFIACIIIRCLFSISLSHKLLELSYCISGQVPWLTTRSGKSGIKHI